MGQSDESMMMMKLKQEISPLDESKLKGAEQMNDARKKSKNAECYLLDYNRKYLIRDGDLKSTGIVNNEDGTRRSSRSSTVIQSKGSRGINHGDGKMKPPKLAEKAASSGSDGASSRRVTRKRQL